MESKHTLVSLNQIKPNPFRRLDLYPLDKTKIAKLRSSIKRTSFWDNIVGREKNGSYELAYGHHRLEAARQEMGKGAKISLLLRDLDDKMMLKVMAADNDDAYNITPGFVLETVRAAKTLYSQHGIPGNVTRNCYKDESSTLHAIHSFLDWPSERVKNALAQLHSIQQGDLDEEALKSLPTPRAADVFHEEIKKAKKRGHLLSKERQRKAAKRVTKRAGKSASKAVKEELRGEPQPIRKDLTEKKDKFTELIQGAATKAFVLDSVLEQLVRHKAKLYSNDYKQGIEATGLAANCHSVMKNIVRIFSHGGNSGKRHSKKLSI